MHLTEYLKDQRVAFDILLHRPVVGATRLAAALHVPGRMVAKGVLVVVDGELLLAVLPATHRLDLDRLAGALGCEELRLAYEEEVERTFRDCQPGARPPFGNLYGVPTLVDSSLAGSAWVVCEGNTRHIGVRMRYRDYEGLVQPRRGRIATLDASGRASSRRRAG